MIQSEFCKVPSTNQYWVEFNGKGGRYDHKNQVVLFIYFVITSHNLFILEACSKDIETEEKENFNLEDRFDKVLVEGSSKCAQPLKGGPTRKTKNDHVDSNGRIYTVDEAIQFSSE